MAQLTSTTISGNLSVIGNAIASKIIKIGGTSSQILMADGSTRLISELITDTGATSITTSGSGNAVTSGSYDATTRQITLNKGTTFVTSASSSNMTVSTSGGVITITHPTTTATAAGLYKIGKDSLGHVVIGDAITPGDLGLSTVYKYKGTKTWAELKALTSAEIGDVYSITDKDPDGNTNADWACYTKVTAATGNNYANYWQSLGGKVDLSAYVQGPASSTDNAIARYDSTTGKKIQNSTATLDDSGNLKIAGSFYVPENQYAYFGTDQLASFRGNQNGAFIVGAYEDIYFRGALKSNDSASATGVQLSKTYLKPETTNTIDLGASDKIWKNIYAAKFITNGSSNQYVVLGDGTTKALSDFATGGKIKVKANDVLAITTDNELSTKYTNTATTTVDVGGLSKGTSVDGWSLKQIIDKLLYKYQAPSVGSLTITGSQNNDYIGGTVTISKATISVSAGSTTPAMKSSSLSWNGATYTGNNAGSAFTAFSSKTITFTINKTWTSTASDTTFEQLTGTATINLTGGKENGTDWSTTKTGKNSVYYFDRSEYYWGGAASATGTAYNKDNTSNNTQRNKLGSGTGTALTAVLNNQVFTVVLPKKWGTTLKVYDGASNPVTGVFKNAGEVTITNKNNYNETYIVWKGAAATGTIKYFFQVS
jgi:hypothetical protein